MNQPGQLPAGLMTKLLLPECSLICCTSISVFHFAVTVQHRMYEAVTHPSPTIHVLGAQQSRDLVLAPREPEQL